MRTVAWAGVANSASTESHAAFDDLESTSFGFAHQNPGPVISPEMKGIARRISESRTSVNLNIFRGTDANQSHTVINMRDSTDEHHDVVYVALCEITSIVVHRISNGIADNRRLR